MGFVLHAAIWFTGLTVVGVFAWPYVLLKWGSMRALVVALVALWAALCALALVTAQLVTMVNVGFELRMRLRNPQASAVTVESIRRNPQKSAEACVWPGKCWDFPADRIRRVRYAADLGTPLSGLGKQCCATPPYRGLR